MDIKLVSSVIFVRDVPTARRFYEEILGLQVEMDLGVNIGYVGGLGLWQAEYAQNNIFGQAESGELGHKNLELYFETANFDEVCAKLESAGVEFIHSPREQPWGQRVIHIYDPDRHIVEIGEPMPNVILRYRAQGMSDEAIAQKTYMPLEFVKQIQ